MHPDSDNILRRDPLLQPYASAIAARQENYDAAIQRLMPEGGTLAEFANGHLFYGLWPEGEGWVYREWAPAARAITLFGDFNGWDRQNGLPLTPVGGGNWVADIPAGTLSHGDKLRIAVETPDGVVERLPLYSRRVVQNPDTYSFDAVAWNPEKAYRWRHAFRVQPATPLLVYECHVGMSAEGKGIASFADFTENVLPRVHRLGYTAVQLMAVMEHPYYGSFGYQVSNFFAVSSRFGTPEDFKRLVDTAHGMGIAVILDVIHSHAARNEVEGLARFDGTGYQFFHTGPRGEHPQWGTKLFNYGSPGVIHFLLSNLKFWLEEYHLDGFRFDGVTSMLYRDHGIGKSFGSYSDYFSPNTDAEAVTYLQLATTLVKELRPDSILIAEDVSGMPGMCLPVKDGGIGFDYRLAMGVPDYWIHTLRTVRDEHWNLDEMWRQLTNRRPGEKTVGYCECHDQAIVGDKTIMFRLADEAMYWDMDKGSQNTIIERAVALHKIIRLVTFSLAGEGYLNFMGNEFGHPEWIDFPREGNGYSYAHAQRMWSLADNPYLRYHDLEAFDKAMLALTGSGDFLGQPTKLMLLDNSAKSMVFRKGEYVFLFNFHPTSDYTCCLGREPGQDWGLVLHTGWEQFGGFRPDGQDPRDITGDQINIWVDRRSAAVYKTIGLQ